MELVRNEKFEFEGRTYELRVYYEPVENSEEDGKYTVRAFLGERPANGYSYSVDSEVAVGFYQRFGYAAIDHLLEDAREDIQNRIWERYLEAMREEKTRREICERLKRYQLDLIDREMKGEDVKRELHRIERMIRKNRCS